MAGRPISKFAGLAGAFLHYQTFRTVDPTGIQRPDLPVGSHDLWREETFADAEGKNKNETNDDEIPSFLERWCMNESNLPRPSSLSATNAAAGSVSTLG